MTGHFTVRYRPRPGDLATTRAAGEMAAERHFPTKEAAERWAATLTADGGHVFEIDEAPTGPLHASDFMTLTNLLDRAAEHHATPGTITRTQLQAAAAAIRFIQPGPVGF